MWIKAGVIFFFPTKMVKIRKKKVKRDAREDDCDYRH